MCGCRPTEQDGHRERRRGVGPRGATDVRPRSGPLPSGAPPVVRDESASSGSWCGSGEPPGK
ncbi:hypothetical protein C0216_31585 (plasmid) [Streptomyces globosus]|uniref:Uncharacterized protein n=1 Tax=Streptomyces globosus TaxID=68209 RepID=A0A344UAX6_9ACTN|nr:hypothetical protein C0216_31585 [Streptomyces globosus]